MNFCSECKHCYFPGQEEYRDVEKFLCGHPKATAEKKQSPINGQFYYIFESPLSAHFHQIDEPYPPCYLVNDGNCGGWEPRVKDKKEGDIDPELPIRRAGGDSGGTEGDTSVDGLAGG